MAPNPLGASSLNPLHLPMCLVSASTVSHKLPSMSGVAHVTDPSPRQTTKKCNSKIRLEDPTPKRTAKMMQALPWQPFWEKLQN